MRLIISIALILFATTLKAQSLLPVSFFDYSQRTNFANNIRLGDSLSKQKWSFNRYSGISTSFSFFKGGSATVVSAPMGLQLNRRLTNNLYAFANVGVAPAYVNFNQSFISADINKNNPYSRSNSFGVYSSASLGLMYVNDAKTFSISGSLSVERSSYPMFPYYQMNSAKPNAVLPVNR